jgi:hypothetical protein
MSDGSFIDNVRALYAADNNDSPRPTAASGSGSPYGRAAKDRETAAVAAAAEGTRNDTLNRAAFSLGQLIAGGELGESEAVDALRQAGIGVGLKPAEVDQTIRSGLAAGRKDPRTAPARDVDLGTGEIRTPAALGGDAATDGTLSPYQRAVAEETARLRVRDEAARIVRQERTGALAEPTFVRLDRFLEVEDEPVVYRVDQLWPVGGRVVCAAQYKAGKTTLRNNLARALADRTPFLGHFTVEPPAGRIAIIDNELDERMVRRWLRDQGIVNTDRVEVCCIRGNVATLDLLDPDTRSRWAAKLKAADVGVLLFDCLRPVLDALGLSEDKDAGRFLVAFDALLAEAGISEGVVVHHMGHSGERSRGDTRIRDWPDVEWRLLRDKDDMGEQTADTRNVYFSAFGRDVDVPEGLLTYDDTTRHLTLAGGTRRDTAGEAAVPDLLRYLADNPDASGRSVETALLQLGHKRADIRTAIARAVSRSQVTTREGSRRAVLHSLTPSAPSAPGVRQRSGSECASAPIGGALHSHTQEIECATGALNDLAETEDPPFDFDEETAA